MASRYLTRCKLTVGNPTISTGFGIDAERFYAEDIHAALVSSRGVNRPLIVVTASTDAMAGWMPLQDRMATLSSNRNRLVPYTHTALATDHAVAQSSIRAILDVVHAVRSHALLNQQ